MICPYCKEEIIDGAIKCKHCGSILGNEQEEPTTSNIITDESIDALLVSDKFKKRFHFIKARFKGKKFGFPDYGKLSFSESLIIQNYWAFFLFIFYYLIKGMWRKGIILLLLHLVMVLPTALFYFPYQDIINMLANLIIPIICMTNANYDLYRKLVLKEENFWW